MMSAVESTGSNERIWFTTFPDGKAQALTNEISSFEDVSVTADGSKMISSQSDRPAAIWLIPLADPTRAKKLTSVDGRFGDVAWTPDGRVVYTLGTDLWIMSSDGSDQRQLTFGPGISKEPHPTIDGRYILFTSSRTGDYNIWRLDLASGELRQLTSGGSQVHPLCTPDGKSYIYTSRGQDKTTIWKAPLAGGDPVKVVETNMEETLLAISPDGKSLSYHYREDSSGKEYTSVQPIDGGPAQTLFPAQGRYNLQWSPDGRGLVYADTTDIWIQPINGGPPKRLTNFLQQQAIFFALSDDGKNLLVTRGDWTSDIVLIDLK
jgi:Tol biopolymer transport system component